MARTILLDDRRGRGKPRAGQFIEKSLMRSRFKGYSGSIQGLQKRGLGGWNVYVKRHAAGAAVTKRMRLGTAAKPTAENRKERSPERSRLLAYLLNSGNSRTKI